MICARDTGSSDAATTSKIRLGKNPLGARNRPTPDAVDNDDDPVRALPRSNAARARATAPNSACNREISPRNRTSSSRIRATASAIAAFTNAPDDRGSFPSADLTLTRINQH